MAQAPETTGKDVHDDLMALLKRRGYLQPAYDIYGGVAGFYDYGPLGARLKDNVQDLWRELYVLREGMAEVECPTVSPEQVFRASGHLERFADPLAECRECGVGFRADHLLEEAGVEGAEDMSLEEIDAAVAKLQVACPECGGALGEAYHFNLMFRTAIGPGSGRVGYLRPETAQGIFMDFPWLYRYFRERLPFGGVQIGHSYRNEISPRQGVIRMREFSQMEAEVFFDPEDKAWPGWDGVADMELNLLTRDADDARPMAVGDAVAKGIVGNEAVGHFLALTAEFLEAVGLGGDRLRFRQHGVNEMSHYSSDTWDAEFLSPRFGWVEIVGVADRTDYDLSAHQRVSGQNMQAFRRFDAPREVEVHRIKPDPSKLGPLFKGKAKGVMEALEAMDPDAVDATGDLTVEVDGEAFEVPADAYTVERRTETQTGEFFTPHVVEPSYGADRIIYAILEGAYDDADPDRDWVVLRLPPRVAPIKAGVFPLMTKDGLDDLARGIHRELRAAGLHAYYDEGGNIGRRYARMDEVGTPFCITVDYDTLEDGTVTIRHRDTAEQARVPREGVAEALRRLVHGEATLADVAA